MLPDDLANLEQAGLRGLMRVIGTEHPHLRPTQIDIDEGTDAEQLARQLLSGSEEDETAWRNGAVVHRPPVSRSASPRGATNHGGQPRARRCTPANSHARAPGNDRTRRVSTAFRRGPDRSRSPSAHPASTSPMCLSRSAATPASTDSCQQLGIDFAGVVTAVGPDVSNHHVGDRVGGISGNGCWATFVTCDARLAVTLPAGLTDHRRPRDYRACHRLVCPARSGQDCLGRPGVDPLGDRRCRPGSR